MTGDLVRAEETLVLLQNRLYESLTNEQNGIIPSDDATVEAIIAKNEYYRVKYIMIQHNQTDAQTVAANLAVAQALQQKAAQGMDFDELCSFARQEADSSAYQLAFHRSGGSYFIKGYLDAPSEAAVLALGD